jgi:Sigma-70 region 3
VPLRPELARVLDALLAASPLGDGDGAITLDAIGDALGVLAVSQDEIDELMHALERAGRRVVGPEGRNNEATLGVVLDVARVVRAETGKAPTPAQIAARTGLPEERVRHALALARVIAK